MKNPIKYNIFVRTYKEKKAEDKSVRIQIQTAPAMIPDIKAPTYWQLLIYNLRNNG
jgi:hypothetical protein